MRSLAFNAAFGAISVVAAVAAALAGLLPGRGPVQRVIRAYVRAMTWAMRWIAGIEIEVRGRERLPAGDFILAPKHASYGDGFSIYGEVDDLAIVTGDHLERFPLLKTVLTKLGAIVVKRCGGPEARQALSETAAAAHEAGRKILIYPEGALAPVGVRYPYHSGVHRMARAFGLPVVPVASSLGLYWPQEDWTKRPGRAVLEFLDPIVAEADKRAFLDRLETAVEDRTAELIAEARGGPVIPAVRAEPSEAVRPEVKRLAARAGA